MHKILVIGLFFPLGFTVQEMENKEYLQLKVPGALQIKSHLLLWDIIQNLFIVNESLEKVQQVCNKHLFRVNLHCAIQYSAEKYQRQLAVHIWFTPSAYTLFLGKTFNRHIGLHLNSIDVFCLLMLLLESCARISIAHVQLEFIQSKIMHICSPTRDITLAHYSFRVHNEHGCLWAASLNFSPKLSL